MGLFIKFRNSLKRRRRISVDVNTRKQNGKPNKSIIENQIVDNDDDFVFNIDNFFIDKREVNKNKYNEWIEKNIDSNKENNENDLVSKNNKINSQIPKNSIMNTIPFDVFGDRKVYSSFHTTQSNQENQNIVTQLLQENVAIDSNNINDINNDFYPDKKAIDNNESLEIKVDENLIETPINENEKEINDDKDSSSINDNENDIEDINVEVDNNESNLFVESNKEDLDTNDEAVKTNNSFYFEEFENLDLDIDLDEGQMSIEKNIEKDKTIILEQGFPKKEKNINNIKNHTSKQNDIKLISQNSLNYKTINEIASKLNKPSIISKTDGKKIVEAKEDKLHKIVGELKIYVKDKINAGYDGPFRVFLDKKYNPFKHCKFDEPLFKQISLSDFKDDANFEDIKKIFEKIYKLKKDPSVIGYIGELIFYKILTQKDKDGFLFFNNFISTFFKNITPRVFKNKNYEDLLKIDWKSLTNIKSDFDFGITFEQEISNKKVTMANKTWNCEIKSTNNKFSRKHKKDYIKLTKEQILNFLSNEVWQVFKIHGLDYEIKENVLVHKQKKPCIDIIKIDRSNFLEMIYKQKNDNTLFI